MAECSVTALTIFPVKGCQGVPVAQLTLRRSGIVGDRELMLVRDGENYAQRDHPQVATIAVAVLADGGLRLSHPRAGDFVHSIRREGADVPVKLLYNDITTLDQGDEVAAWACAALAESGLRLVSLPRPWNRWIPLPEFEKIDGKPQAQLYDVAPILLNNQASLDDFNSRTREPVPMDRFRANVVVAGGLEPYQENAIATLGCEAVELAYVTKCERCIMTTTDQKTGERPTKEPLKTLSSYRKVEEKYASGLVFGAYMTVAREGTLAVGDRLAIALA